MLLLFLGTVGDRYKDVQDCVCPEAACGCAGREDVRVK